jgi:hypothetical protein
LGAYCSNFKIYHSDLSAVQLGWRVVVKLQIANEHTPKNANEISVLAELAKRLFTVRDAITRDCH